MDDREILISALQEQVRKMVDALGKRHFIRPKTPDKALEFIDGLFDTVCACYPEDVQGIMKSFYYERKNILFEDRLIEDGVTNPALLAKDGPFHGRMKQGEGRYSPGSLQTIIGRTTGQATIEMKLVLDTDLRGERFPIATKALLLHEMAHCGLQNICLAAMGGDYSRYVNAMTARKDARESSTGADDCAAGEEIIAGTLSKIVYDFTRRAAKAERHTMRPAMREHTRFKGTMREYATIENRPERDYMSDEFSEEIDRIVQPFVTAYRPPETKGKL